MQKLDLTSNLHFTLKGELIWDLKQFCHFHKQNCHSESILTLIEISCSILEVLNSAGDKTEERMLELSGTQWTEGPRIDPAIPRSVYLLYLPFFTVKFYLKPLLGDDANVAAWLQV